MVRERAPPFSLPDSTYYEQVNACVLHYKGPSFIPLSVRMPWHKGKEIVIYLGPTTATSWGDLGYLSKTSKFKFQLKLILPSKTGRERKGEKLS